jgi:hypothetical protein
MPSLAIVTCDFEEHGASAVRGAERLLGKPAVRDVQLLSAPRQVSPAVRTSWRCAGPCSRQSCRNGLSENSIERSDAALDHVRIFVSFAKLARRASRTLASKASYSMFLRSKSWCSLSCEVLLLQFRPVSPNLRQVQLRRLRAMPFGCVESHRFLEVAANQIERECSRSTRLDLLFLPELTILSVLTWIRPKNYSTPIHVMSTSDLIRKELAKISLDQQVCLLTTILFE